MEALRTQLDAEHIKKQQLEVENARLCDAHPEQAALVDAEDGFTGCPAEWSAWWHRTYKFVNECAMVEQLESEPAQHRLAVPSYEMRSLRSWKARLRGIVTKRAATTDCSPRPNASMKVPSLSAIVP